MQHAQKLRPIDYETRVNYAASQLDLVAPNETFIDNILFSNEAHFHLHGHVNNQNFRYWADTNPHGFFAIQNREKAEIYNIYFGNFAGKISIL